MMKWSSSDLVTATLGLMPVQDSKGWRLLVHTAQLPERARSQCDCDSPMQVAQVSVCFLLEPTAF
jgi:hypothetical protein